MEWADCECLFRESSRLLQKLFVFTDPKGKISKTDLKFLESSKNKCMYIFYRLAEQYKKLPKLPYWKFDKKEKEWQFSQINRFQIPTFI